MEKKKIYYEDELKDDFANTNITPKQLGKNFKYIKKNIFWRFFSWFFTYCVAIPILSVYSKIVYGVKFKNKKVLKKLKKTGFVIYGNHAHYIDSFVLQVAALPPKRAYIISSVDAVSIKGIGWLVQMLGSIPLPSDDSEYRMFLKAVEYRLNHNNAIIIYPEAHIWPYYTKIRPFPNSSFYYAVKNNVAAIAAVTTFRKPRKEGKKPKFTITFSEPFYPEKDIPRKIAQENLRNKVYNYMVDISSDPNNYAYYEYIKKERD